MNREVIVVLGMHRSGTSAVTRGLRALGVELGGGLIGPMADNPRGFWEDKTILDINILLLSILGLKWDSVQPIPPYRWQDPMVEDLKLRAARVVQENVDSFRLWGFKDPRTLRLLPFWIEVFDQLQVIPKYLMVVRNPISVAQSLYRRNGISPEQSYLLWSIHVIPHLAKIRNRIIAVIDYDLLMNNPIAQLRRIASRLGIPENTARKSEIQNYARFFLSQDLRHSQYSEENVRNDPNVNDLTRVAYHWLHMLAWDKMSLASRPLWQGWSRLESALISFGPECRYLNQRNRKADVPQSDFGGRQQNNPRIIHYHSYNSTVVHFRPNAGSIRVIRRRSK
ncbi:MAG TPA: sulfotransferase [Spirochaetia bacterium]|nr:sulfotransferase [Spirochaetia bacterium]